MKNLIYILALGWVCCIASTGCNNCEDPTNPDCKNYNPCYGKAPVSAHFEIFEETYLTNRRWTIKQKIDEVVSSTGNAIVFTADNPSAISYAWHVGTETRSQTTRSINYVFPREVTDGQTITIRLIVQDTIDPCFKGDDGIDTFSRTIRFERSIFDGEWTGAVTSSPQDTYTIVFRPNFIYDHTIFPDPYPTLSAGKVINLVRNCPEMPLFDRNRLELAETRNITIFDTNGPFGDVNDNRCWPRGWAYINEADTNRIELHVTTLNGPHNNIRLDSFVFVGRRRR